MLGLTRLTTAIRRNHALEHATVAVLLAKYGPMRIAGRASHNGFLLYADVTPEEVTACAREALRRMQSGQASLAVTPLCGTNIAMAGLLAATAATAVLSVGRGPRSNFGNAFVAAMFAVIAAQPLGMLMQQHVTTSPHLDPVEVLRTRVIRGNLKRVQTSGALS